jgi:predicted LPLAT superfamily acyltransferase
MTTLPTLSLQNPLTRNGERHVAMTALIDRYTARILEHRKDGTVTWRRR